MHYLLIALVGLSACASPPALPPEPSPECYAPWEHEPYRTGRAIPAPGPDATVPTCEYRE